MYIPKPYLPKFMCKWSLRRRQLIAKYYWNPWWNLKTFCEKWVCEYGFWMFLQKKAMDFLVWSDFRVEKLRLRGKAWKNYYHTR